MSAPLTGPATTLALLLAAFGVIVVAGYEVARRAPLRAARPAAWVTLLGGTVALDRWLRDAPAGFRMFALVVFALLVMKVLVAVEARARGMPPLSFPAWLAFAAAWLGMRPELFVSPDVAALEGATPLLQRGVVHLALGGALVALAPVIWTASNSELAASAVLLAGLSLIVHFGVCNLLAGLWRSRGVACEPLFRAPLLSQNLSEFWARRWNLAFSEMTAVSVYRPLVERFGRGPALLAAFAVSGLFHELAISVPVRAGFGLPFLYFVIHGALVWGERALARAGYPLLGWSGRLWTVFWLVVPLPMLFHRPFLAGVVWPLVQIGET